MKDMSLYLILGCGALISVVANDDVARKVDKSALSELQISAPSSRIFNVRGRYSHDRFQPIQLDSE